MDENKDVNLDTISFEHFWMWAVNSFKKYLHIDVKSTESKVETVIFRYFVGTFFL